MNDRFMELSDTDNLTKETYQIILGEVKERFSDHFDEVKNVTSKSIKMLIYFSTFIAFAAGAFFKKQPEIGYGEFLLMIAALLNIILIYSLIKGRLIYYNGFDAGEIMSPNLENSKYTIEQREKIIMFNTIEQTQKKINALSVINAKRIEKFNNLFASSILLSIIISALLAFNSFLSS